MLSKMIFSKCSWHLGLCGTFQADKIGLSRKFRTDNTIRSLAAKPLFFDLVEFSSDFFWFWRLFCRCRLLKVNYPKETGINVWNNCADTNIQSINSRLSPIWGVLLSSSSLSSESSPHLPVNKLTKLYFSILNRDHKQ